jgi:hypothetical protein
MHVGHDLLRPSPLSIPHRSFFNEPESVSGFMSEYDVEEVAEGRGGVRR